MLFWSIIVSLSICHVSLATRGFGLLGCWRDHDTKSPYSGVIGTINSYIEARESRPPGAVLRAVSEVIWPTHDVAIDAMYCFDEEIHGSVSTFVRYNYSNLLEGFRPSIMSLINMTSRNPQDPLIESAIEAIHTNVSYYYDTFLRVMEIERASLYFREYSLLLIGVHAELINYFKGPDSRYQEQRWRKILAKDCYALSKYSHWFLKFMPKKMADNVIFDAEKFGNNQLGFRDQVNAKRLSQYDEALSKCSANDNNNCQDYALGFLKSVRITTRQSVEDYWKDILHDFRRLLFRRYCTVDACRNDRYPEFFIRAGEPVALQFQAPNAEAGKFCASDYCSTMWLSTAGYRDFIYYRSCLGDNPLKLSDKPCNNDLWEICTSTGNCNKKTVLTNKSFPVALRSYGNKLCMDCSATATWCKQAKCPDFINVGLYVPPIGQEELCPVQPENCKGAQFQIQNFERGVGEPLEILDEVHFTYASPVVGTQRYVSGDIYSAAFLRTQYYMRTEDKYTVSSKKTGITSGPFSCESRLPWSQLSIEQRAACAQSSFTLFKTIDPAVIVSTVENSEDDLEEGQLQNLVGGPRGLSADESP